MGITSENRIALFKNRLAPIQISWLGYCNTTGLRNMDFIISDRNLIYPNEENLYTEKIIFLPPKYNATSNKVPITTLRPLACFFFFCFSIIDRKCKNCERNCNWVRVSAIYKCITSFLKRKQESGHESKS